MWVRMDRIGILLFDAAFAAVVFLTIVVLAMLACRQPARRILLARVAMLASLAIPPLVAWGHLPRFDVVDTFVESRFFPRALFLAASALDPAGRTDGRPSAGPGPGQFVAPWLLERASAARRWLPRGLTVLDLVGVAAGVAWLLLGVAGAQWLIGRSRAPSPATRALFERLVSGRPRPAARAGLRVSTRLQRPVVTGMFRTMILIPEALDRPEEAPELLRLGLLHELAHAERSDHRFSTAAGVAQSLWFFLPQAWWIRSQLLIDQEFLADRAAAEEYGTSSAYASSLLSMAAPDEAPGSADPARPGPRRPSAAEAAGAPSPLFQRMMMLLYCPYPIESRTPRVWSWTSRLAVIVASVAAACLVIRWPQSSLAVPVPTAAAPRVRFQAAQFRTEPLLDVDGHWHPRVYVLPLTLPPRFDIDVDIRCAPGELGLFGVVGHRIAVPPPTVDPGAADPLTSDWHHVHIHRDPRRILIVADGQTVTDSPDAGTLSEWLTIEPPPQSAAEFRDLVVSW